MKAKSTILFVSMAPASVGHFYRVINHSECFERLGYRVHIVNSDTATAAITALKNLKLVVVFRPRFDENFRNWRDLTLKKDVIFLADVDDITFDLDILDDSDWHYWTKLNSSEQANWRIRFLSQSNALDVMDGAIVSTMPLAQAVESRVPKCWIWPNGFGRLSWSISRQSKKWREVSQFSTQDQVVIGYASGTPTHEADFAVVVPALLDILSRFQNVRLELLGALDLNHYPELINFTNQIRCLPVVPYAELPGMLCRFDINLAPLDISSRFCAAKSELKFFEAAAVGVPTVASPTPPFKAVIKHGVNGYTAQSTDDWILTLNELIQDPLKRQHLASRAFTTVQRRFSPRAQLRDLKRLVDQGMAGIP